MQFDLAMRDPLYRTSRDRPRQRRPLRAGARRNAHRRGVLPPRAGSQPGNALASYGLAVIAYKEGALSRRARLDADGDADATLRRPSRCTSACASNASSATARPSCPISHSCGIAIPIRPRPRRSRPTAVNDDQTPESFDGGDAAGYGAVRAAARPPVAAGAAPKEFGWATARTPSCVRGGRFRRVGELNCHEGTVWYPHGSKVSPRRARVARGSLCAH